ncbi:MAG: hypothetical protein FWE15_04750 [Actinomycetia bacterium]|nr:hypothetical protein [Actinomycetes bacterium]
MSRGIRFRVYVDGDLAVEDWAFPATEEEAERAAGLLADRHASIAERAAAAGQTWLVELYDPALPEAEAYVRFGSDVSGMVLPVPFSADAW